MRAQWARPFCLGFKAYGSEFASIILISVLLGRSHTAMVGILPEHLHDNIGVVVVEEGGRSVQEENVGVGQNHARDADNLPRREG